MRSIVYTSNVSTQQMSANSVINPGQVIRRMGCNCRMGDNGIIVDGIGYYHISASFTGSPTADGTITIQANKDGVPITGAVASATGGASENVVLPIEFAVRNVCPCNDESVITFIYTGATGTITNASIVAEKV